MIARRPKREVTLEEMIEALNILSPSDDKDKEKIDNPKMDVDVLVSSMEAYGKATEDNLRADEVNAIINDCNLKHGTDIIIEDFAKYLISR